MKGKLLFGLLVALSLSAFGQETDKAKKAGLAIQGGVGNLYGSSQGGMIEYQLKLREKLRITPFVSLGNVIPGTEIGGQWLGYCAGGSIEVGERDRLIASLSYGAHGVTAESGWLDPEKRIRYYYDKRLLSGPAINAGYKGTIPQGFILQTTMGISGARDKGGMRVAPTFSLGIGYKL